MATAKKPSSRKKEFKIADKVVYPAHGVGEIADIQAKSVGGEEHKFYDITILESGMKILVPVEQADSVGLRPVVGRRDIKLVYDILKQRNVAVDTQTWNRRYREYTQKIKTGSVTEMAKVLRDLVVLSGDKELSFGEKKMFDTVQDLLVSEIAVAKSRSSDKVKNEFEALFAA